MTRILLIEHNPDPEIQDKLSAAGLHASSVLCDPQKVLAETAKLIPEIIVSSTFDLTIRASLFDIRNRLGIPIIIITNNNEDYSEIRRLGLTSTNRENLVTDSILAVQEYNSSIPFIDSDPSFIVLWLNSENKILNSFGNKTEKILIHAKTINGLNFLECFPDLKETLALALRSYGFITGTYINGILVQITILPVLDHEKNITGIIITFLEKSHSQIIKKKLVEVFQESLLILDHSPIGYLFY